MRLTTAFLLFSASLMLSNAARAADVSTQKPKVAESVTVDTGTDEVVAAVKPTTEPSTPASKDGLTSGPSPVWIWGPDQNKDYFVRTEFSGDAKSAVLAATADNSLDVFVNGKKVLSHDEWASAPAVDVTKHLIAGKNIVSAHIKNEGGAAAFLLKMVLTKTDGSKAYVLSGSDWQTSTKADFSDSVKTIEIGKLGSGPWGDPIAKPGQGGSGPALKGKVPPGVFQVPAGFQVELLYTVPKDVQGSWVSLTKDKKGRLIASDQGNQGLYRITPAPIGSNAETQVEKLDLKFEGKPVSGAQGLLDAFGSLYVCCNGGPGSGLYRCTDTNGDDQYDKVEKLKSFQGGGEHGPHGLQLTPDGKGITVIAGNHTMPPFEQKRTPAPQTMGGARTEPIRAALPAGVTSRLQANWDEDLLLLRQWDSNGHARGILAPGGWIANTDPDGKTWEMISVGYRNPYDFDYSPEGELFAYDADMEWDLGSPWYRPTRLCHAVNGSEFGWRSATGKWPNWYPDNLPPVVNIGPGSPVGVTFGTGAKFPAKYQRAVYLLDWTFGTIFAVHLTPQGASYVGTKETFLGRAPLPLTDAVVGQDGALYFTVGGRGTQSELYRVTYVGTESTAPAKIEKDSGTELRVLRRKLETLQVAGKSSVENVNLVWPLLSHSDRFIRYAARVGLEFQDVALWEDKVIAEKNPVALINGAIALAHVGEPTKRSALTASLAALNFASLSEETKLELLRAEQLVFIRLGQPDAASVAAVLKQLDAHYPSKSMPVDRELCINLVFLNSPTVIGKTLAMMTVGETADLRTVDAAIEVLARNQGYGGTVAKILSNQPNLQQMHYAFTLRNMRFGWTLEQRKQYFAWYEEAAKRSGGNSYQGFLKNMRTEALANASDNEKKALEGQINLAPVKEVDLPKPIGPGREYSLEEAVALAKSGLKARNFEAGKRAYSASRCISCHRFDGEGGSTGPDLTNVAGRFSQKDLLESIIDPSKVISDQYKASIIETKSGKLINGRVLSESNGKLLILTDPVDHTKIVEVAKDDIETMVASPVSLMPQKLLGPLNQDEVLDLLAYMLSRGNAQDGLFAK